METITTITEIATFISVVVIIIVGVRKHLWGLPARIDRLEEAIQDNKEGIQSNREAIRDNTEAIRALQKGQQSILMFMTEQFALIQQGLMAMNARIDGMFGGGAPKKLSGDKNGDIPDG